MSKVPKFVLISDIHFSLQTLELAATALSSAFETARVLNAPLIIAGDLNDTKAILRGEVANKLIQIFKEYQMVRSYLLVGNHDLLNEKGQDNSLHFLQPYTYLIELLTYLEDLDIYLLPYQNDSDYLKNEILAKSLAQPATVIMHQGFKGACMGDYIQDKTSIEVDLVKHLRIFSGHYHKHQTIGTVTYIGSPYTITFGEANDGPKGYLVVNQDNSFEQIELQLRKHVIIDTNAKDFILRDNPNNDLLWYKISGTRDELKNLVLPINAKIELFPTDEETIEPKHIGKSAQSIFDDLIVEKFNDKEYQSSLLQLWKELLCE